MPHGVGGGSHRSGGHHSSHHSSHHSGGSSGSYVRTSTTPFPNCRRFRYRHRSGYRYIYSNAAPSSSKAASIFTLIFLLPFILADVIIFPILGQFIFPPKKLNPEYQVPSSYISDERNVIDNEDELNKALDAFRVKTGICPYVVTVNTEQWNSFFTTLEDYSYDRYVNSFRDEQHLLLVYSLPAEPDPSGYEDWEWYLMAGDDTDFILNQGVSDKLLDDFQRNFTIDSYSVGQAIALTFEDIMPIVMRSGWKNDKENASFGLLFIAIWNGVIILFIVFAVKSLIDSFRKYEEVPMNETPADSPVDYSSGIRSETSSLSNTSSGSDSMFDYSDYNGPEIK